MKPDIEAIKRRCEAATGDEWKVIEKGNTVKSLAVVTVACDGFPQQNICSGISPKTHDAEFITHARQDILALLAYIDELREQLQVAQADNEQAENLLRIAISLMKDNPYSRDDDWNELIVEAEKFLKAVGE